jgi:DNA processing protein
MLMGDKRRFWIGFNRVQGIGAARLRLLLDAFGDIETAWGAGEADLLETGLGKAFVRAIVKARENLDLGRELARIDELGFQALTWEDEDYPERLREIALPPPVLYVWGKIKAEDRWAAAVVGTRKPTGYGKLVVEEVSAGLAASGVTVVSGLARGIDGMAHRGALEAGGRTIAVLGSGLDRIYPPEHRKLADEIVGSGAIITDYPLGTAPEARNFPPRNRIISGMALAVVIVEAGEGSGALITADFAVNQGREVFAVPGSIFSSASRGTLNMIRDGANPLTSVGDVLEALNMEAVIRHEQASRELPEDAVERKLLEVLTGDPVHIDDLHAQSGLPVSRVTAALAMLELKGRVRQVGGMQFVRTREIGPGYKVE